MSGAEAGEFLQEQWQSDAMQELRGQAWTVISEGSEWAGDASLDVGRKVAGGIIACCTWICYHGIPVEDIVKCDIFRDFLQFMALIFSTICKGMEMMKAFFGNLYNILYLVCFHLRQG